MQWKVEAAAEAGLVRVRPHAAPRDVGELLLVRVDGEPPQLVLAVARDESAAVHIRLVCGRELEDLRAERADVAPTREAAGPRLLKGQKVIPLFWCNSNVIP